MPLNLPNFIGAPTDNLLEHQLQGYNSIFAPQMMQNRLQADQLANALNKYRLEQTLPEEFRAQQISNQLNQARVPYAGEVAQAELDNLRRQSLFSNYTGAAREALSLEMLRRQYGEDSPVYKNALQAYELGQENTRSNIGAREALNTYRGWNSLNQAAKENTLATGRGIAPQFTDRQLADFYANGGTHEELGQLVGKSPAEVAEAQKVFGATNATISAIQQGEGALAEEEVMGPFIAEGLGAYPSSFFGYSPAQVADAFKKGPKDVDKQAKFLAARALAAEQAAIRARLAGASNASEALRDLKAASLNEFKIFRPLVSSDVYAKTQRYIDEELGKAAKARFAVMRGKSVDQAVKDSGARESRPQEVAKEMITIRNPKTGETLTISREEFERSKRK